MNKYSEPLLSTAKDIGDIKEARRLVKQLREKIAYHDHRYFVLNDPVVSDYEYDQLVLGVRTIENKWPELITPDSPTQRIGEKLSGEFPEVEHLVPMLSLDNSYEKSDLQDFDKRVKKALGINKIDYSIEPKLDGTGISLIYENDHLVRGTTRGDGIRGEDVTNNLRVIRSIPLRADFSSFNIAKIEIRGEVLMKKKDFKTLNLHREKQGLTLFANPRNAAAGSLRLKDPKMVSARALDAWLYQIAFAVDKNGNDVVSEIHTQKHAIEILHAAGFKSPVSEMEITNSIGDLFSTCDSWRSKRESFPYEIDGLVIKVNDLSLYKKLGFTSHHPRWAIAYKFEPRQGTTALRDVVFSVGRSGAVTPIGKVDPVHIGGVTISSVSLHNEDFIKDKDIRLNDVVILERAGDVIPYVVKPVIASRPRNAKHITFPDKCPSCKSPLVRLPDESAWRCVNINCPVQVKERIMHFVYCMGIEGMGVRIVERFYDEKIIRSVPDVYRMDYKKILRLEGFGVRSVEKLRKSIEASKTCSLHSLLDALGIRYVGYNTAHIIEENVSSLEELMKMKKEEINALPGIGDKVSQSIYQFFKRKENRRVIDALQKEGVEVYKTKSVSKNAIFSGKTFVFTGELEKFTRAQAKHQVEQFGGRVMENLSSKTDYLVAGKAPGAKLVRAKKLKLMVLKEAEFRKLLGF